ncbi:MAG: SAM-dependent DNA methyltransferase [Bacteroidales bacterium]|nr:SAM-dependent DNA methyltransferase [Bacteroidales bacterium]
MPSNENTKQIKSRQRVADHGEVFTNPREVNAMIDLVRDESFRLDSRFLEPACGDGNFLIEILRRKLSLLQDLKSQTEWEFQSLIAVGSCYGIDILPDNAEACRTRLEHYVLSQHPASERLNARSADNTIQAKRSVVSQPTPCSVVEESPYLLSLRYMLQKNIVCGDALTYRTAEDKPITFCEWTPIAGSMQFSRRDFQFDFLVTQSHQYSLFDEQGEVQSFDEPVKSYPPVHYTQLFMQ